MPRLGGNKFAMTERYMGGKKAGPNLFFEGCAENLEGGEERPEAPLYAASISAGFPSPADDYIERKLDLHRFLVRNEIATFFLRASGDSMIGVGIHDGDLLVVDRSIEAANNRIVIAALDGELTVKRILRRGKRAFLAPANPAYPEIEITEREHVHIWGVVTYAVHRL